MRGLKGQRVRQGSRSGQARVCVQHLIAAWRKGGGSRGDRVGDLGSQGWSGQESLLVYLVDCVEVGAAAQERAGCWWPNASRMEALPQLVVSQLARECSLNISAACGLTPKGLIHSCSYCPSPLNPSLEPFPFRLLGF